MIVPGEVKQRFMLHKALVSELGKEVRETVLRFCEENGYAYLGRQKTIESLSEKLESGRFMCWSDIDDLFACTVVIPTLQHEESVIEFMRSTFNEHQLRKRGSSKKAPDVFRFDSTRFIGKLKPFPGMDATPIQQLSFEVQIKSSFDHAWAVATHDLVYKSGEINWKRLRLAGQMKAVVEQLDALSLAFDTATDYITESQWEEVELKKKIAQYFDDRITDERIPAESKPKDLSRVFVKCDVLANLGGLLFLFNSVDEFNSLDQFAQPFWAV